MQKTNATQRLYDALSKMDRLGLATSTAAVLTQALGSLSDDQNRSMLLAYASLVKLIETAEIEARKYYEDEWEAIVSPHFSGVRACFTPTAAGTPWNQRKSSLTAADLTGLKHTAEHLKRHVHEVEISDEASEPLGQAISELEDELEQSHLSEYSRQVLQESLERIKNAVREHKLWGVIELKNSYHDLAGRLLTDATLRKEMKQDRKRNGKVGHRLWVCILALNTVLQMGTGVHDLKKDYLPSVKKFLLPSPQRGHLQHSKPGRKDLPPLQLPASTSV